MVKKFITLITPLIFMTYFSSCGNLSIKGGSSSSSDSAPTGTIVFQGTLSSLTSDSFSGIAAIYLTTSGTFTARLESFSTSSSASLRVTGTDGNGDTVFTSTLKSTSGDQNYTTGVSSGGVVTWSSLSIINTSGDAVATALLQSTS